MAANADLFLVVDVNITSVDFSSLMSNKNLWLELISPKSIYYKYFVHGKNS
jgi:hypothetical protein